MLDFTSTFKIYVHKDTDRVSWSIRVTESHVHTYNLSLDEFAAMLSKWHTPGGHQWRSDSHRWTVEHKLYGPAPARAPADYVKISVGGAGQDWHYRVDHADMIGLEREFMRQTRNTMPWD